MESLIEIETMSNEALAMSLRLPNAKVTLYSDAGHGSLFQHVRAFGHEVLRFLREDHNGSPW